MKHVSRALAVLVALVGLVLVWTGTPTSLGAYTSKVTNTTNTAASSVWATTCLAQAKADGAYFFYDLDENVSLLATTAADSSGNGRPGTYTTSGVSGRNTPGPCPRDTQNANVATFNGTSGYVSGPQIAGAGPTNFSEEVWFKTNTTTGGNLMSLGTARTGSSGTHDRHLYMNNDGRLTYGIYDGAVHTIQSSAAYNNNVWHHAVATTATSGTYKGMRLYVDGQLVASDTTNSTSEGASNYWVRIAYDNLQGWTSPPSSYFFKGSMADVAFYNGTVLTPSQVAVHYASGT